MAAGYVPLLLNPDTEAYKFLHSRAREEYVQHPPSGNRVIVSQLAFNDMKLDAVPEVGTTKATDATSPPNAHAPPPVIHKLDGIDIYEPPSHVHNPDLPEDPLGRLPSIGVTHTYNRRDAFVMESPKSEDEWKLFRQSLDHGPLFDLKTGELTTEFGRLFFGEIATVEHYLKANSIGAKLLTLPAFQAALQTDARLQTMHHGIKKEFFVACIDHRFSIQPIKFEMQPTKAVGKRMRGQNVWKKLADEKTHQLSTDHLPVVPAKVPSALCASVTCRNKKEVTLTCAVCRKMFYCNKECQRADWKFGHRLVCKAAAAAAKDALSTDHLTTAPLSTDQ